MSRPTRDVVCAFDINPSFWDAPDRGEDTYILCYDGVSEWWYTDGVGDTTKGRVLGKWASYDEQLTETKVCIVRIVGYDVQDSRLHATNHRGDSHVW